MAIGYISFWLPTAAAVYDSAGVVTLNRAMGLLWYAALTGRLTAGTPGKVVWT